MKIMWLLFALCAIAAVRTSCGDCAQPRAWPCVTMRMQAHAVFPCCVFVRILGLRNFFDSCFSDSFLLAYFLIKFLKSCMQSFKDSEFRCPQVGAQACPLGFSAASSGAPGCFAFQPGPLNASAAAAACAQLAPGAALAKLDAPASSAFAISLCKKGTAGWPKATKLCLIGLNKLPGKSCVASSASSCGGDTSCKCAWRWADGAAVSFTAWNPGKPSYYSTGCAAVSAGSAWFDTRCSLEAAFICEALGGSSSPPPPPDPTPPTPPPSPIDSAWSAALALAIDINSLPFIEHGNNAGAQTTFGAVESQFYFGGWEYVIAGAVLFHLRCPMDAA